MKCVFCVLLAGLILSVECTEDMQNVLPTPPPTNTSNNSALLKSPQQRSQSTNSTPSHSLVYASNSRPESAPTPIRTTTLASTATLTTGHNTSKHNEMTSESNTKQTEKPSTSTETSTSAKTTDSTTTMHAAKNSSASFNSSTSLPASPTSKAFNSTASITSSAAPQPSILTSPPSTSAVLLTTINKVIRMSSTRKPLSTLQQHRTKQFISDSSPKALSSATVAAIVIGFIFLVIFLLGGAYYFKIRRPSYGRLLDDTEYRSLGNIFNPMFNS